MPKATKKKQMVCVKCGHEVERCGKNSLCELFSHEGGRKYFCGNCGENGSHQRAVEATKWVQAQKLRGLPSKINSYDRLTWRR